MSADAPTFLSVLPTFLVRDVRAAAEHYRDAFGFRLCWVQGERSGDYAIVDLDEGHGIHLSNACGKSGRRNRARGGTALDAYIRVADVERVHALATACGARVLSGPVDRPWGMREIEALDLDGYALCFGQDTTGAASPAAPRTSPELLVNDIEATKRFYREVFGFDSIGSWGEPPQYAIGARGGAIFHFARAADPSLIRSNHDDAQMWDAYVEVRAVDALEQELRGRGADVVRAPTTTEYGMREMKVRDHNGYVICFGELAGS